jgi:hypothetical protein
MLGKQESNVSAPVSAPPGVPGVGGEKEQPASSAQPPTSKSEAAGPSAAKAKEVKAEPPKSAAAKAEPPATEGSADTKALQSRIDARLAQMGLAGKVRAEIEGNRIRLTGEASPGELRRLRQAGALGSLPRGTRLDVAVTEAAATDESSPRVLRGGEIEVFTDVHGARALAQGPNKFQQECKTPCRFEDLVPGRYTLEVSLPGYRTERRIVQVAKSTKQISISFQAAVARLQITSRPDKAEIYVDGRKQPEMTPATIVVPPGSRRLRLQRAGFVPYEETIDVEADAVKRVNVELPAQTQAPAPRAAGFLDVRTIPRGADILINGADTGRKTPDKLELAPGTYTLTLFLRGYQAVRETIIIEPNQTLQLNRTLPQQ